MQRSRLCFLADSDDPVADRQPGVCAWPGTLNCQFSPRVSRLDPPQVSLLPVLKLLTIPSPTTCCRSRSLVWFLSETYRVDRAVPATPLARLVASWASPLTSWLATTTGRIEFVKILRTGHSPPVALHPASRRRSYVRLQRSNPTLTGTSTPPFQHHRKRTSRHAPRAVPSGSRPREMYTRAIGTAPACSSVGNPLRIDRDRTCQDCWPSAFGQWPAVRRCAVRRRPAYGGAPHTECAG